MKQHRTTGLLVVLACALALSACKKEENTKTVCMKVQFERAGSQKVYIGGDGSVYWNVDDEKDPSSKVLLWTDGGSPSEKTITNAGIEVPESGTYAAVFPSTGSVNKKGGHAPIPAEQTYRKDSKGDQIVEAPMAARQTGNKGVLYFRNLGGLIRVRVSVPAAETMSWNIQRIEVTSASEALSGDMYFSFDTSTTVKAPELFGIAGNASNSVSLTFPEAEILTANTTKDYYLAAAPFDSSEISIKVTYLQDRSFLRTLTLASGNGTDRKRLGRSGLGAVDMSSAKNSVLNSFRISATDSVVFAPGNLQYQASNGGRWRFAEHQWVSYTNTSEGGNYTAISGRATQEKWIDLFGYGTSGYDGKYPYQNAQNAALYASGNINNTNYDWGVYNAISNPKTGVVDPAGTWRTLTKDEWDYLLKTRPGATVKVNNVLKPNYVRFVHVTVKEVNGILLFPDNADISIASLNPVSDADWNMLEKIGAVFLPLTGQGSYNSSEGTIDNIRSTNYAMYLTSTGTGNKASSIEFSYQNGRGQNEAYTDGSNQTVYYRKAVRLARNIPSN